MADGKVLEFSGVTKVFGDVSAVSDLTARVEPGVVTAVLGPNGAGKTTSLRILLGDIRPTSGTATIGGSTYSNISRPARTVGAVLETPAFRQRRTATRQLTSVAKANGIPLERVREVLDLVGPSDVADMRIGSHSLGMRQRLSIAQALLGDPGVLVFDEPVNGMDPEGIRWMRLLMRRLADEGRTVLMSSHLLSEVQQIADRILIISNGKLVFAGDLEELADVDPIVIVDSPDRAALVTALRENGYEFEVLRSGVNVRDARAKRLGEVAASAGIALSVLHQRGASLEDVFLDLVNGRTTRQTAALAQEADETVPDDADASDDGGSAAGEASDEGAPAESSDDGAPEGAVSEGADAPDDADGDARDAAEDGDAETPGAGPAVAGVAVIGAAAAGGAVVGAAAGLAGGDSDAPSGEGASADEGADSEDVPAEADEPDEDAGPPAQAGEATEPSATEADQATDAEHPDAGDDDHAEADEASTDSDSDDEAAADSHVAGSDADEDNVGSERRDDAAAETAAAGEAEPEAEAGDGAEDEDADPADETGDASEADDHSDSKSDADDPSDAADTDEATDAEADAPPSPLPGSASLAGLLRGDEDATRAIPAFPFLGAPQRDGAPGEAAEPDGSETSAWAAGPSFADRFGTAAHGADSSRHDPEDLDDPRYVALGETAPISKDEIAAMTADEAAADGASPDVDAPSPEQDTPTEPDTTTQEMSFDDFSASFDADDSESESEER